MSQEEIKKYLLNKRLSGCEDFYTIKEICNNLTEGKKNIHKNINKLYFHGIIELETTWDRDLRYGTKHRFIRELLFPRRFRISQHIYKQYKNNNTKWFHTCTYINNKYIIFTNTLIKKVAHETKVTLNTTKNNILILWAKKNPTSKEK